MSTQNLEQFYPPIQSDGLNTNKAVSFGSTLSVTGVATFAAAPVFNGGQLATVVNANTNATLTVAQSGSTVVFNRSLGTQITLPVPTVGTYYNFVVASTPTSGTTGIRTDAGTTFLVGALSIGASSVINENGLVALANGTSNTVIGMNGTTTGGILGSSFRATAITSTLWEVSGVLAGSGSLATPIV